MIALVLLTQFGSVDICEEFLNIIFIVKERTSDHTQFSKKEKTIVRRRDSPPIWETCTTKKSSVEEETEVK